MSGPTRPAAHWQLPPGITRGLWEYAHNAAIADDYDDYFAQNSLFDFDEPLAIRAFQKRSPQGMVADLGCGTGRALVTACQFGYRGLAIDLSQGMLDIVAEKARLGGFPIRCLRANFVELDGLADSSLEHAMCLFSTLGMIRGRASRMQALKHVHRIVKPGGGFVLHVHNFWFNLYDPHGCRWVAGSLLRSFWDRDFEAGDKFFSYRGVPNMFLHVFRRGEIVRDLKEAGFQVDEIVPLASERNRAIRFRRLFPSLRANGWVVICTRPQ